MPQETKAHPDPDAAETPSLQGLVASREDEKALLDALENAFDYRGDCTIKRTDGSTVTGYIFDRRTGTTLAASTLRLLAPDSTEYTSISYDTIDAIEFSGKDPAHGKTFERWVERYVKKKLAGEKASIESEPLD